MEGREERDRVPSVAHRTEGPSGRRRRQQNQRETAGENRKGGECKGECDLRTSLRGEDTNDREQNRQDPFI